MQFFKGAWSRLIEPSQQAEEAQKLFSNMDLKRLIAPLFVEQLLAMLDEERLRYVGSMVLGLNDALVELTGTLAGLTFALQDNRLVALSGLITGISATFSMASSEFLSARSSGRSDALKSCVYTGIAYLITVALLVLPYLLLRRQLCRQPGRHAADRGSHHRPVQLLYRRGSGTLLPPPLWRNGRYLAGRRRPFLRRGPVGQGLFRRGCIGLRCRSCGGSPSAPGIEKAPGF